ncbi:MAG TPA: hypothetical protein VLS93_11970 [Anaeromyxobacteraceae bacterium]|nr:hypothetical protein [Anaeromyxobacteraceae bacterium]
MLDAYVIEEIRRRERESGREERPVAELPVPDPVPVPEDEGRERGERDRGVVIIDYSS